MATPKTDLDKTRSAAEMLDIRLRDLLATYPRTNVAVGVRRRLAQEIAGINDLRAMLDRLAGR